MENSNINIGGALDMEKICRSCLTQKSVMRPLFGASLHNMLASFSRIEIQEDDGLPQLMCVQCVLQCSRAYNFKLLCEKSDIILTQYLSPEFQEQSLPSMETCTAEPLIETVQHPTIEPIEAAECLSNTDYSFSVDLSTDGIEGMKDSLYENITVENISDSDIDTKAQGVNLADSLDYHKYCCSKCGLNFTLDEDLQEHMLSHGKKLEYRCDECGKVFAQAKILRRHAKIHVAVKPYNCDQCDMSFADSCNLRKHKKKHTGELRNMKNKPHLCSVCGHAFKWASSLYKHMKYHTGANLFSCKFCDRKYAEARSLKIHIRSHTGERPHICTICPKSFTQLCNLEKHVRTHTGEKPYSCSHCGKSFSQSGYVAIHMRTHTGERPYVCPFCNKSFVGATGLNLHIRKHTVDKPQPVDTCGNDYIRKDDTVLHQRTQNKLHNFESDVLLISQVSTNADDIRRHDIEITAEGSSESPSYACEVWSTAEPRILQVENLITGETHSLKID